jgi:hypothetical protein
MVLAALLSRNHGIPVPAGLTSPIFVITLCDQKTAALRRESRPLARRIRPFNR